MTLDEVWLTCYKGQYLVSKCGRTGHATVSLLHTRWAPKLVCSHTKTARKRRREKTI